MNSHLTSKDWKRINDIILEMNYESDILKALNLFLVGIDKMVPYEKATVYFYTLTRNKVNVDTRIGPGFDKRDLETYDEYYCKIDDIVRKNASYQTDYRLGAATLSTLKNGSKPNTITIIFGRCELHFSLDSNFRWNKTVKETSFGSLDLFRTEKERDFTDKEVEICKILQPHLETKASQYVFSFVDSLEDILSKFFFYKNGK